MTHVWIEDIVEAFEDYNSGWKPYVNVDSGEVIFIPLKVDDFIGISEKEIEIYSHIEKYKQYVPLPSQKELREYDIMEEYAMETLNKGIQKRLLNALGMTKPFRNFRTQLHLLNLEDDYNQYRYMVFASKARHWCLQNNIPFKVESDEIKEFFKEIEEDEKLEKELEEFQEIFDEFEYPDEFEE